MTIIEALVKLRNDLKLWVANNLRVKMDKNLGAEESGKFLTVDEKGDIVTSTMPSFETKDDAAGKLTESKTYTDEAIENVKTDIANQDAVVLSSAQTYVDGAIESIKTDVASQDMVVLASAQSYVNEVAATKVNKISDTSTSITVTVADNIEYRFPNATTVNITCPDGEYECWIKLGTSATTVSISNAVCMTSCSLTPENLTSGGGHIEISIKDGIYIIQKVE